MATTGLGNNGSTNDPPRASNRTSPGAATSPAATSPPVSACVVETGIPVRATSDLALALRSVLRLPAQAVVLADRNFGVFAVAYAAQSSGRDAVVRLAGQQAGVEL